MFSFWRRGGLFERAVKEVPTSEKEYIRGTKRIDCTVNSFPKAIRALRDEHLFRFLYFRLFKYFFDKVGRPRQILAEDIGGSMY